VRFGEKFEIGPLHRLVDFYFPPRVARYAAAPLPLVGSSCSYTDSRVCFALCTVQVNMSRSATVHGQDPNSANGWPSGSGVGQ